MNLVHNFLNRLLRKYSPSMNTLSRFAQGEAEPSLTIGVLADRTGVKTATLRMWEQRHGFPAPQRLDSGHRRYAQDDVDTVRAIIRRREAGVRLDVAIAEAVAEGMARAMPASPSVYAVLRRQHPHLTAHRLRKSTLLALSWAMEDAFCAQADRAHIFGSFQRVEYFELARARWTELARVAGSAFVFADFEESSEDTSPVQVALPHDAPMRREWTVVCDAVDGSVALTAWELPGQSDVRDRDRIFESMWSVDPAAVRDAARVCAQVAGANGAAAATAVQHELAGRPAPATADLASVNSMFNRVVDYVDRFGRN